LLSTVITCFGVSGFQVENIMDIYLTGVLERLAAALQGVEGFSKKSTDAHTGSYDYQSPRKLMESLNRV
jgi:hypothetical protein